MYGYKVELELTKWGIYYKRLCKNERKSSGSFQRSKEPWQQSNSTVVGSYIIHVSDARPPRERKKKREQTNERNTTDYAMLYDDKQQLSLSTRKTFDSWDETRATSKPNCYYLLFLGFFFFLNSATQWKKKGMIVLVSQQLFHFRRPSCLYIFFFSLLALKIL